MEVFATCHEINSLIQRGDEVAARNLLIRLLASIGEGTREYPELVNHMIRATGLFPYMEIERGSWDQRFVAEAFAIDVGGSKATLHREQSYVLKKLLEGTNLAVSAPTSFGKSFITDAFIAAKMPITVVIIVPTIALMDETRRRIFQKFGRDYAVITAPDTPLGDRNILIFPQERAFGYLTKLVKIDLLVVDEFYKASAKHDKDRSPALVKAILKLSAIADQRYYLAPNVKRLGSSIFTDDMEFIELLNFNTVYLNKHELYREINGDESLKGQKLIEIIGPRNAKSLIYAGTYVDIRKVCDLVKTQMTTVKRPLTQHFAEWLRKNYRKDWQLPDVIDRGVGVHNGSMHRCLTQIQVKLFEQELGLDHIVSTSSIIEGVNTSAQNVVIWRNRVGSTKLKDFTYKNIIGRGGQMFKYFVGDIYLLEPPPEDEETQLSIEVPEQILGDLDEEHHASHLTSEQLERVIEYKNSMVEIVGREEWARLQRDNVLQDSDSRFLLLLATDMKIDPENWNGFAYLNSDSPNQWERILYKLINFKGSGWEAQYSKIVAVTKAIHRNWSTPLSTLLSDLDGRGISIDEFFQIERTVTFKLSALVSDANELYRIIVDPTIDVSRFIARLSRAFLPGQVYHLEEFGLPRMISRKIQDSGLVDLAASNVNIRDIVEQFNAVGLERLLQIDSLSRFDKYILKHFVDGITPNQPAIRGS